MLTWLLELQLLSWVFKIQNISICNTCLFCFMLVYFIRTKAQPPIYYMPAKPLVEDATAIEQRKEKVWYWTS